MLRQTHTTLQTPQIMEQFYKFLITALSIVLSAASACKWSPNNFEDHPLLPIIFESSLTVICRTEAHVINVYFDDTKSFLTSNNIMFLLSTNCDGAPLIVETYATALKKPVELKRPQLSSIVCIINDSTFELIGECLSLIKKSSEGKQFRRYFLVFEKVTQSSMDWLRSLFREFWMKKVLNVVVIYYLECITHAISYHPFSETGFSLLNLTNRLQLTEDLFFNKLTNMNRHQIIISMYNQTNRATPLHTDRPGYGGVDGRVADLIIER